MAGERNGTFHASPPLGDENSGRWRDASMTFLQAIRDAVEAGTLQEPFRVRDVAAALQEHHFSYGTLQAELSRYSRQALAPALRRVGRGLYRLAAPRRTESP